MRPVSVPASDATPLFVLRWGRTEYDPDQRWPLPEAVSIAMADGASAPLEEAEVLVVPSAARVDAAAVARLRRCRLVITTTSGHDHLDLAALAAAGIPACRLPLVRRDAVVETTLAMILALNRRLGDFQVAAREGRWARAELPRIGATLLGTVGVVGVGVIGSRMCTVLEALGARVLRCDPALEGTVPLATLCAEADVVTLHCALTPLTRGLMDAAAIAGLRPGAVLVNTARGALLDPAAAVAAVRDGRLAGVGLDVFPDEPARLAGLWDPRVIVTPHAAGWHPRLEALIGEGVARAIEALRAGAPIPFVL